MQEPRRKKNLRYTVTSETAPLPAVAITWLIPPAADSADRIPLEVAAALLSQGDSSRLYQSLVYRHQVAQQVGADADAGSGRACSPSTRFSPAGTSRPRRRTC